MEIKQKLPKSEIELDDKDYAMYLTLKELVKSINNLANAIRNK